MRCDAMRPRCGEDWRRVSLAGLSQRVRLGGSGSGSNRIIHARYNIPRSSRQHRQSHAAAKRRTKLVQGWGAPTRNEFGDNDDG
jgi:hypothetical protein